MSTIGELRARLAEAEAAEAAAEAARLAELEAARKAEEEQARLAADEQTRLSEELQPEDPADPEPEPADLYYRSRSLDPEDFGELVRTGGHHVGGHPGLGAGVAN